MAEHEYATISLLLDKGLDIELIPTSQIKGMRTPDISVDGILWEIKSPTGNSKSTIKHTLQKASHQSTNVIVDLRRIGINQDQAIKELENRFYLSKRMRRMKIITNEGIIVDFAK